MWVGQRRGGSVRRERTPRGPTIATGVLLVLVAACQEREPAPASTAPSTNAPPTASAAEKELTPAELGMFAPLPKEMASEANPITDAKVQLGRMLYYEKRVSKNHDLSCNSCHQLDAFGVDGEDFRDGRAPDVEKQAEGPVLNPVEMAMPDEKVVLAALSSMPEYVDVFAKAFPGEDPALTYTNFGKAIGAFERKLVTPSRWDDFLAGDAKALTAPEKQGVRAFMSAGCIACHTGAYLGGTTYQKVGAVKPWPNQKDAGRYDVTKKDADKMLFKVPGLRNVAKTAPYFHDASAKTLPEAVPMMAEHLPGKTLSKEETTSIVTFLEALTGKIPTDYVKQPTRPPSTPETPKPDPS